MATITVKGKTYRPEYHNKCELCDLRGIGGECTLPKSMECEHLYVYKRDYEVQ